MKYTDMDTNGKFDVMKHTLLLAEEITSVIEKYAERNMNTSMALAALALVVSVVAKNRN